jgi:transposase
MRWHAGVKLPKETVSSICRLFQDGKSKVSIAKDLDINRRTVYRYVRQFNIEKPDIIKHGTHAGYTKCKCEECRAVHSEYMKDYKQRRRNGR